MTDYGHDLMFGAFITPVAQPPLQAVDLALAAERAGLDLVTFQDHPYQPLFHDTWTLLAYVAARTTRIHLSGNVLNLALRQPAVLARSASSLDRLTGGRIELGVGAGAFWNGIAAMGGRRLTPGQSVAALHEAITIVRELWATDRHGDIRFDGTYYQLHGAMRGPAPAHPMGIWVGAYKPRMLTLTGGVADGWLVSLDYVPGGAAGLAALNAAIDDGAAAAGRRPSDIRRLLNISAPLSHAWREPSAGPAQPWAETLAALALDHGISGFILATDDAPTIERLAAEVAPATRALVGAERARRQRGASAADTLATQAPA